MLYPVLPPDVVLFVLNSVPTFLSLRFQGTPGEPVGSHCKAVRNPNFIGPPGCPLELLPQLRSAEGWRQSIPSFYLWLLQAANHRYRPYLFHCHAKAAVVRLHCIGPCFKTQIFGNFRCFPFLNFGSREFSFFMGSLAPLSGVDLVDATAFVRIMFH